jgi:hypothetical protein
MGDLDTLAGLRAEVDRAFEDARAQVEAALAAASAGRAPNESVEAAPSEVQELVSEPASKLDDDVADTVPVPALAAIAPAPQAMPAAPVQVLRMPPPPPPAAAPASSFDPIEAFAPPGHMDWGPEAKPKRIKRR